MPRRTKIVATMGPATAPPEVLADLAKAGSDVARLNLAHADHATHKETAAKVRAASEQAGRVMAILADLPGPKMRTGPLSDPEVFLHAGDRFVLTDDEVSGDKQRVSSTVDHLTKVVDPGDEIYLADGAIVLTVVEVSGNDVVTEVVRGGVLRSKKGMHLPGAEAKIQAFTPEDQDALEFALTLPVDLVGLSFVRDADDVQRARAALPKRGPKPLLVAKVETRSAVEKLDEIVQATDAVMVARGDLGIQMPLKDVPILQKRIIRTCNEQGVPVITATQMLESMTRQPLPTRAEVGDVANAVLDGTDAVMLSEETAMGSYPVETVRAMSDIVSAAEAELAREDRPHVHLEDKDDPVSWAVARAAVQAAEDLQAAAIVCPTRSGATARRVAAFRPEMPVLGLGHSLETVGALALVWGVVPYLAEFLSEEQNAIEGVERAVDVARSSGCARAGDLVVVVAGGPGRRAGSTDFLRIVSA